MLLGRQTSNFNPCMVALGSFLPGSRGPVKHRALVQFIRNAEVRQRPIGTSDAVKLDLVLRSHCRQANIVDKLQQQAKKGSTPATVLGIGWVGQQLPNHQLCLELEPHIVASWIVGTAQNTTLRVKMGCSIVWPSLTRPVFHWGSRL